MLVSYFEIPGLQYQGFWSKAKQDWVLKRGGGLEPLALNVIQQAASACSILQS
jgi:hypothetical protein